MSWLWSTAPTSDEANPKNNVDDMSIDPYAADPLSTDRFATGFGTQSKNSDNEFGTAFSDDFDANTGPTPQASFDIYATAPPPTSFDMNSPQTEESSSVNFSTMGRIDPTILSPRSQVGRSSHIDYVFADDYRDVRKKSGAEQLTFLAGSGYLFGMSVGGTIGAITALRASGGKPARLRVNALLNGAGKNGSRAANMLGVLALAFSLSESAIYNYTNDDTIANYAFAGAASGALYKSTRGVRVAGVWALGGMAMTIGGIWASRQGYYGRGLQGLL